MANEKMEKLENLKETNKDNMLNEEELHEVDGGFNSLVYGDGYGGWANDSRFLNVLLGGAVCDRYGNFWVDFHVDEIKNAWRTVGVEIGTEEYRDYTGSYESMVVYKIAGKKLLTKRPMNTP